MRRTYTIVGLIVILAAGAVAVLMFTGRESGDMDTGRSGEVAPLRIFPITISEAEQKNLNLPNTFKSSDPAFSFSYPEGFTASRLPGAEGGETVVVQDTKRTAGFQIHLEPYEDPDTDITTERLARDIPEMKIKEVQDVWIGGADGADGHPVSVSSVSGKGLAFIASDTGTREVWFIFGGTLFQLTAPIENDTLLQRVLGTWSFQ